MTSLEPSLSVTLQSGHIDPQAARDDSTLHLQLV